MAILRFLVLNLGPFESSSVLAQDMDGETRIPEDGLILTLTYFPDVWRMEACFLCCFLCVPVFL